MYILTERVEKYEGLSNQHEKHAMHLEHQLEQETEALRMEQKEQQTLSEQVDRLQKDVKYARIEVDRDEMGGVGGGEGGGEGRGEGRGGEGRGRGG